MKNTNCTVTFEKSFYTSIFNIKAIDEKFESDIYEALNKLRHGGGRHYLRKYNNRIFRIEFVADDDYYVGDEFGKMHAEEIKKVLTNLAYKFGTKNALFV